ncbi:hypothetical protein [Deinococcus peraridilitoris]|uniref:Tetratricopeptide repeat protein n=1 Tax=Deinococcus peraridilitoris (strain DSM 19664 / LMG 22246 / CIP 109416 / KR-200) TaxID=937777 RepID=L0A1V2_DEIPD|nr:hypothetical protein [Deinococcus peraridilitoris]AFZ67127.1 hypothetical protein Deipe_1586 [Deinococcus peraridilitoris DSM 19664]
MEQERLSKSELALNDPVSFDALLGSGRARELQGTLISREDPLGRARYAMCLGAQGDLAASLSTLEDVPGNLASGWRLMMLAQLNLHEQAIRLGFTPGGSRRVDLEGSCHAYHGLSMAYTQSGDPQAGLTYLRISLAFAQQLGMQHKDDILSLELERVSNLVGQANPDRLRLVLARDSISPRRRAFGEAVLAEGLMLSGDYAHAMEILQRGATYHEQQRELLNALLLHTGEVPREGEAGGAGEIARGIVGLLMHDEDITLGEITGEPEATYARLVQALAYVRRPGMAAVGARMLEGQVPRAPDQRALWAFALLGALMHGAPCRDPLALPGVLRGALEAMPRTHFVLRLMHRIAPEYLVLAGLAPNAHPDVSALVASTPLLVGKQVAMGRIRFEMPGRVGRILVLRYLAPELAELEGFTTTEFRRFTDQQSNIGFGHPVNMGLVARSLLRLARAARDYGAVDEIHSWNNAYEGVLEMLSDDVRVQLKGALRVATNQ